PHPFSPALPPRTEIKKPARLSAWQASFLGMRGCGHRRLLAAEAPRLRYLAFLALFLAAFLAVFLAAFLAVFLAAFLATFLVAFLAAFLAPFLAAFLLAFLAV